jgi:hypothetical protein
VLGADVGQDAFDRDHLLVLGDGVDAAAHRTRAKER